MNELNAERLDDLREVSRSVNIMNQKLLEIIDTRYGMHPIQSYGLIAYNSV